MTTIAKPGDHVLFIGRYDPAMDDGTEAIMREYLFLNHWYTV